MSRLIFIILACTWSVAVAQSGNDSTRIDTTRLAMKSYIGISSAFGINQRSIGLPEEVRTRFGNDPVISLGISAVSWGDLLFQTSAIRWGANIHKLLNAFPNPRIFENLQSDIQFGYAVLETPQIKIYPFLGTGTTTISLDSLARLAFINVSGGMGVDYFLPNSPLAVSLQAAYNHSFNLRSAANVPNSESGLTVRIGCYLYLRSRYNYWGWD